MTSERPLAILLFLGSARESSPPSPPRLGLRLAHALAARVRAAGHGLQIIDPLAHAVEAVFKPHFAYARGEAPPQLDALAETISAADGHIMLSPEYNHMMSPALSHLLNHFAASRFAFRPSAIATYSAGQWGGARAAVSMRTFLGELGCIPVSAMIHVPKAQEQFDEDGSARPGVDEQAWNSYFDRTLKQLFWWAKAARTARTDHGVPTAPFARDPAQRNAPA